jgi:MFS superfamily sulfate permease-like transporter
VCVMLLFLPSLLANLPNSALGAIVIAAALSLMDFATMTRFLRIRSSAFVLALAATLGVVFFGVLEGILIAVALSILTFFKRGWWPAGEVLGRVGSLGAWHRTDVFPEAVQIPGVVVFRWEAPLFFANAGTFRQTLRRLVKRSDARRAVVQCEAITDIDVTAAEMLQHLDSELGQRGVELVFVQLRTRLRELLARYGLEDTFDRAHFYDSIDDACAEASETDAASALTRVNPASASRPARR